MENTLDLMLLVAAGYFLPAIIARVRHHRHRLAIFMLTTFAGWTFIGWVGALVWACTADVEVAA